MSPITFQDARDLTDPDLTDEQRDESARRIMDGVAANDVYWASRSQLEALQARADGHGVVVRATEAEDAPTGGDTSTAIDGTATEDQPATALGAGEPAPSGTPVPSPDNPNEAVARLRQQLVNAGLSPEA